MAKKIDYKAAVWEDVHDFQLLGVASALPDYSLALQINQASAYRFSCTRYPYQPLNDLHHFNFFYSHELQSDSLVLMIQNLSLDMPAGNEPSALFDQLPTRKTRFINQLKKWNYLFVGNEDAAMFKTLQPVLTKLFIPTQIIDFKSLNKTNKLTIERFYNEHKR